MKNYWLVIKSFIEFMFFKMGNSEKWFYKSLDTYKKNYFSIIHSGNYNLDKYTSTIQYMLSNSLNKNIDPVILKLSADFYSFCSKYKTQSNSQFLQDLFVLYFLNKKKEGFFVEFGACDGIDLSNTHVLEKKLNWNGILAEPNIYYYQGLIKNRSCNICNMIVYNQSDLMVQFTHVIGDAKLSTISKYTNKDNHKLTRAAGELFEIKTITLDRLLDFYNAPKTIDFISIDTEGSELEIIKGFSFSRKILTWTVEHNHNQSDREILNSLMNKNGYKRVLEGFSQCDDWYVDNEVYQSKIDQVTNSSIL